MSLRRKRGTSQDLSHEKTHPAFSKRKAGDYLLVAAEDGLGFYFPGAILKDQSAVLKDGYDLVGTEESEQNPIEFPMVTSATLCAVLKILTYAHRGNGGLPKYGVSVDDEFNLYDVLLFADIYAIKSIPGLLYSFYKSDLCRWDRFFLALRIGNHDDISAEYTNISFVEPPTSGFRFDKMDESRPKQMWKLHSLYWSRYKTWVELRRKLCYYGGHREVGSFAEQCCQKCCSANMKYRGSWASMREHVGTAVWETLVFEKTSVEGWDRETAFRGLEEVLKSKVACSVCIKALSGMWKGVIKEYFASLPRWRREVNFVLGRRPVAEKQDTMMYCTSESDDSE